PTELIQAMPPAAATPLRNPVGSDQKTGSVDIVPAWASVRPISAPSADFTEGLIAQAVSAQPTVPTKAGTATCQRRSPVRSECSPLSNMQTTAQILGIAVSRPT